MSEELKNVVASAVDAASNPKVATGVAAGAASLGSAAQLDLITGWMARISVTLGAITAAVVLAIQVLKLMREIRGYRKDEA